MGLVSYDHLIKTLLATKVTTTMTYIYYYYYACDELSGHKLRPSMPVLEWNTMSWASYWREHTFGY